MTTTYLASYLLCMDDLARLGRQLTNTLAVIDDPDPEVRNLARAMVPGLVRHMAEASAYAETVRPPADLT